MTSPAAVEALHDALIAEILPGIEAIGLLANRSLPGIDTEKAQNCICWIAAHLEAHLLRLAALAEGAAP